MKSKNLFFAMACALLLTSCHTPKDVVTASELQGEWDIVKINGASLPKNQHPYIGFNAKDKRVYGYSGCNRLMGSFNLSSKSYKIELGHMASTMMACTNMDLEMSVLGALTKADNIKRVGDGELALYGESEKEVLLLQKRFNIVAPEQLEGEWRIMKVFGNRLPNKMENTPCVIFDIANKRYSGNAGCNTMTGGIKTDGGEVNSLSFTAGALTRMACPNMQHENMILASLGSAKSYGILRNGNLALFNGNGELVMELTRNK